MSDNGGKVWSRERPTSEGWYYYSLGPSDRPQIGYVGYDTGGERLYFITGLADDEIETLPVSSMARWWAPVTPPPFDGE